MDYVFDLNTLETTGIIECPYCGRSKAYVYNNATGKLSSVCNICGRIVLWDFHIKPEPRSMLNNFILEATRALRAV